MFRKTAVISVLLCIAIIFLGNSVAFAAIDDEISAPSAILVEAHTGKVLYEKNAYEQMPCASITKVMTLLLVFEAIESGKITFEDNVTASAHAAGMGGSDIWLVEGETMTVHEMIKATVVASANDAAVALAELVSGTEGEFVDKMNERAKQLGMTKTIFKNCNGLDEEGHITCAYDVSLMSCELMKHEKIFEYTSIWLDYLRDGKTQIVNTNKLLKTYKGITGLKTGTTNDAGSCISASATRDGLSLNAVVLGCKTGKERFADAAALLDYGFANYCVTKLDTEKTQLPDLSVEGGMTDSVKLKTTAGDSIVTEKNSKNNIEVTTELPKSLNAPVEKNQRVGTITYKSGDNTLAQYPIVTDGSVEEICYGSVFRFLLDCFLRL